MNVSRSVYSNTNSASTSSAYVNSSNIKSTRSKTTPKKISTRPGISSTQPTLPVQPNDNKVAIIMGLILTVGIALIGYAFYAILGM